jgi:hypothetical protein
MLDRKSLVSLLWLTSLLTLLAAVFAAPIRTSRSVTVSPGPSSLRRDIALALGQPTTRLSVATATDTVPEVNALPSENEELDGADALDGPRVCLLIPCSFRKVPDRQFIAARSILSHYPLRC